MLYSQQGRSALGVITLRTSRGRRNNAADYTAKQSGRCPPWFAGIRSGVIPPARRLGASLLKIDLFHAILEKNFKEVPLMKRIDKQNYYLDIAETVLERSTCMRRCYGAIIVKNDEIVSTGYNGAPRGRRNCLDLGYCTREAMNVPSGERYELCRSVHAEMNAIISAARRDTLGATLYLAGREAKDGTPLHNATSCSMCRRVIINAGIERVVIREGENDYSVVHVEDWVREDDSLPKVL